MATLTTIVFADNIDPLGISEVITLKDFLVNLYSPAKRLYVARNIIYYIVVDL